MPFAVAFNPAITVAVTVELEWTLFFNLPAEARVQFISDPIKPQSVDSVFETGIFPVRSVSVITLDGQDLLTDFIDFVRRAESDHACQLRVRVRVAMRHAHAAS